MKKIIISLLVIAALIWSFSPLPTKLNQERQIAKLKKELKKEKTKNARLKQEIHKLKNDKSYIEAVARQNFGLIKPDEEAYLVVEKVKIKKVKAKPKENTWWQELAKKVKQLFY